ncbi:MAG: ferrous iron transport protein A [Clostridia bacterium]|nr:ferrous iron transport protein A [Clostridia bacterium]
MSSPCPLCDWPLHRAASVVELLPTCALRRRLMDFGLCRGITVRPLFRSPSGDPTAYQIGGTVLALRDADAAGILVCSTESRCLT